MMEDKNIELIDEFVSVTKEYGDIKVGYNLSPQVKDMFNYEILIIFDNVLFWKYTGLINHDTFEGVKRDARRRFIMETGMFGFQAMRDSIVEARSKHLHLR